MTGRTAVAAPDTWVCLFHIGAASSDGGGDPLSLAEAAGRLETGAGVAPKLAMPVAMSSVRLDPARHLDEAWGCLSVEESRRAARFFKDADRVRYVLAHAMLRTLLARRLAVAPVEVGFAASPNGKPRLAGPGEGAPVAFNLSYGDAIVALAFASRTVGVDVEAVRDNVAFSDIGRRFFRPDELRYLESGSESGGAPGVRDRFFRLWTRKEAVLKALGMGLGGLGEVSVLGDLVVADAEHGGPMRMALQTLPGPPGHALALAVETAGDA